MKDIVPELLEKIQADFERRVSKDAAISEFQKKVNTGKATLEDVSLYGRLLGDHLAGALLECITLDVLPDGRLYFNIADRIIDVTMHNNYNLVNEVAAIVQRSIDEAAGIGLNAVKASYPIERIMAVINGLADSTAEWETIRSRMDEPIRNISQSFVDDFILANAAFRNKSGLRTYIIRKTAGKCCKWCSDLAGSYAYPEDVPKDVFRRHDNCRCTVVFKSDKGTQNVWSKKWTDPQENVTLQTRKIIGLSVNRTTIKSVSGHMLERIKQRDVDADEIVDAITKPLKIKTTKTDPENGKRSFQAIGEKATIAINPDTGNITTVWRTSRKLAAKLKKER